MDYYERKLSRSGGSMRLFALSVVSVVLLMAALLFTGCKSVQYVPVPEYHHDSVYITKVEYDSIYKHDSVLVEKYAYGDTLYVETTKWHTQYKYKLVHDTLLSERVDSVPLPIPVEKKLTKWQQTKIDYGGEAIIVVFIFLIVIIWLVVLRLRS